MIPKWVGTLVYAIALAIAVVWVAVPLILWNWIKFVLGMLIHDRVLRSHVLLFQPRRG